MRRSIKKAVAFALATATMVTSLSVTQPIKAAEYGDVREVLPKEYEWYAAVGENAFFVSSVSKDVGTEAETSYVDDIAIVNKNGEKISVDVKTTDGKYKYTRASQISEDYVAMIKDDGSYDMFMSDGTWFANRESKYDEIYPLYTGNFCVKEGDNIHIADKTGKILAKNVFKMGEDGYVWSNIRMGEYIFISAYDWSGKYDDQLKVFDKDYKEITTVDFNGLRINNINDEFIAVYSNNEVNLYDTNLKRLGFNYKVDVPKNPSVSAEQMVLTDRNVYSVWSDYDYNSKNDILCIGIDNYYADALGNTNYKSEYVYVNLSTLEILPEDSVDRYSVSEFDITNTDLSYYSDKTGGKVLLDGKVVVDDKIADTFVSKNMQGLTYLHMSYCIGSAGNLYLGLSLADEDYNVKYNTIMLEKSTGYDLSKAKIFNKEISGYVDSCGGCIWFSDSTFIVNGKEFGKESTLHRTYSSTHYGRSNYYVLSQEKDAKETYTLYDKNHDAVLSRNDMIEDMVAGVNVVISDSVELEGYNYPVKKYGCVSFTKTLETSEEVLEEVLGELENIEEGEKVEVEVKKDVPIKAEIFKTIKGKDVEVEVKLDNGMSWNINGKNVESEKLIDVNLTVDVVKDVVPAAAIEKVELKGEKIELSLAHTGNFGFTAELKMNVKAENAGKFANRFFYNPDTKQLEFQEAVKIDEKGDAIFTYTHASDYVVILSDVAYEAPVNTQKPDETVKPGDMTNIGLLVALLGVSAVAFISQKKKIYV